MKNKYTFKARALVLLNCFTIFLALNLKAQVSGYTFNQSVGTYTAITGGTVLATATGISGLASLDDTNYTVTPGTIPFSFIFDGTAYTGLTVNTNGYVVFGTAGNTNNYNPISGTGSYSGCISAAGGDLNSLFNISGNTGEIRYQTVGTAPNREFVLQWSNFRPNSTSASTTTYWRWNFQIRLKETSNAIDIVYDNYFVGTPAAAISEIGLRGTDNTFPLNINNRTVTSGTNTWATSGAGINNAAVCISSTTLLPSSGQTYTWTPPPACTGTPVAGATASSSNPVCTNTNFTLSLSGATTGVSGLTYQWQSSPDNITYTNIPVATDPIYQAAQSVAMYYKCFVTCTGSGLSATSTPLSVTMNPATYATVPYLQSFETSWINQCDAKDIPSNEWRNNPATGNNSWRKADEGASALWTGTSGSYFPEGSVGTSSARFHSFNSTAGLEGTMDLYLDLSSISQTAQLSFDCINNEGTDTLFVSVSTDGGNTFGAPIAQLGATGTWASYLYNLGAITSATTVIRFKAKSDFGNSDIGLDNVQAVNINACTGTPTAGTTASTASSVCIGSAFTLSLTGATTGIVGLTYQWQSSTDNVTYTNIPLAINPVYTTTQLLAMYYRCLVTCTGSGLSAASAPLQVTMSAPSYASLPYVQSFETSWLNGCDVKDIPGNEWRNSPVTGNNSWRKVDEGPTASWSGMSGAYLPTGSVGTSSARFHSFNDSIGLTGNLDLYLDLSSIVGTAKLSFDYINVTGTDSLFVSVSTNGGSSFSAPVAQLGLKTGWGAYTFNLGAITSPTTVIRFKAKSDDGDSDIGLDNVKMANINACTGTPTADSTVSSSNPICPGYNFTLSLPSSTADVTGITYQWQSSPDNVTYMNIPLATHDTYTGTETASTYYKCIVTCTGSGLQVASPPVQVILNAPTYATIPYIQSFETSWIDGCNTKDIPGNEWRNNPVTGDNSWRKVDEGATAWTTINGFYTPTGSAGSSSARFHSYDAASGQKGNLDLYLNLSAITTHAELAFDYINASGTDSLFVSVSTDGGSTFAAPLALLGVASNWSSYLYDLGAITSATTVIRFEAKSDYGLTDIGLDNIVVSNINACVGTPLPDMTISTLNPVCTTSGFTLGLTNGGALSLNYQWQSSVDNITYSNIPLATQATYVAAQTVITYYKCLVTCATSGLSITSTPLQVNMVDPVYAPVPYSQSFETSWVNGCGTKDIPSNEWRNNPITGDDSWRKFDEGITAWSDTLGGYSPSGSVGTSSARFHTYEAADSTTGAMDLYLNLSSITDSAKLSFDYINPTGKDILTVSVSTDGGSTFAAPVAQLDSTHVWVSNTYNLGPITSATTVIRFKAKSDYGYSDLGFDNVKVANSTALSVADNKLNESFKIYPNPSNGMFTITVNNSKYADISIAITDIQGKEVYRLSDKNNSGNYSKQVDLSNLAKGIYYIKLNTGADVEVKKLIVQ